MANRPLHDGSKIHDTPKMTAIPIRTYPDYNCGFGGINCDLANTCNPSYKIGGTSQFAAYWERHLFRRVLSILDFTVPENWDKDYFLWVLFRVGFIGVIPSKFGVIPQFCTIGAERNVYYQPTRIVVANPLLPKNKRYIIGENAGIIKLTPDYMGIWDIIKQYAEQLAMLTQSLRMAIVNTRMTDGYITDSNAVAQTIRTMLEQVDEGAPTIVLNGKTLTQEVDERDKLKTPWFEFHNDVGKNYIIDKLIADTENLLNLFCREIGVPVMSDKKERQIESEVETAIGTAFTATDVWYDTLTRSIDQVKKVFPDLELSVKRMEYNNEGVDDNAD